jgi:tetratricopeptide (TPR) repeat protein
MEYYRNAIAIKSDLSDAYVNLGNVLEFKNRYAEAVECYEAALRAEPKAVDIQQLLQAAREKLK